MTIQAVTVDTYILPTNETGSKSTGKRGKQLINISKTNKALTAPFKTDCIQGFFVT
jgi:hypothetical protein